MSNIKKTIAKNLVELRKKNKLTQLELADRLHYSDKAVSRWESGETLPDVEVLDNICEIYGVKFEYLLHEGDEKDKKKYTTSMEKGNKATIALLAISVVWFLVTLIYVYANIIFEEVLWELFVWAVPASFLIALIFTSIWSRRRRYVYILISFFVWTLLASFYVQTLQYNLWLIFILGAPVQVGIILWSNLKKR